MKIIKVFLLFSLVFFCSMRVWAYNTFYPEADATLKAENIWVETLFKEGDTEARTVFRAWMPYAAKDLWPVMINANEYHNVNSDYSDSRMLDENQFNMVVSKNPDSVKGFYEIIGAQKFPWNHGRQVGGVWTSYVFQRFNLPWPLKDRWNVMKVKNIESKGNQSEYRYEYKTYTGNFKSLKGWWALVPVPGKPGWTEFRGDYKSDPGVSVPNFLAKKIFKASMKRSVKNYQNVLERKQR